MAVREAVKAAAVEQQAEARRKPQLAEMRGVRLVPLNAHPGSRKTAGRPPLFSENGPAAM